MLEFHQQRIAPLVQVGGMLALANSEARETAPQQMKWRLPKSTTSGASRRERQRSTTVRGLMWAEMQECEIIWMLGMDYFVVGTIN